MKVQMPNIKFRFGDLVTGETFIFNGTAYMRLGLSSDNNWYAVSLVDGYSSIFYDETVVQPVKFKVLPEE